MSDPASTDAALLLLRVALGIVFVAHGWNHIFGGGRIAGTASWFESLGMRPGRLHAWTASITEVGSGALLMLGLATPLACAGVVGTMAVAFVTNHRGNGFFIFRPGEGYEYVMTLILVALGVSGLGAGTWSLDHAIGWFGPSWWGLAISAAGGFGGAALLLAVYWRPAPRPAVEPASQAAG